MTPFQESVLGELKQDNKPKTITLKQTSDGIWSVRDNTPPPTGASKDLMLPIPIIRHIPISYGNTEEQQQTTAQTGAAPNANKLDGNLDDINYLDYLLKSKNQEIEKNRRTRRQGRLAKGAGAFGLSTATLLGGEGVQNVIAKGVAAGAFANMMKDILTGGDEERRTIESEQEELKGIKERQNKLLAQRIKGTIESSNLMNGGAALAAMGPEKSDVDSIIGEMKLSNKLKEQELDFMRDERPDEKGSAYSMPSSKLNELRELSGTASKNKESEESLLGRGKDLASAGIMGWLLGGKKGGLLKNVLSKAGPAMMGIGRGALGLATGPAGAIAGTAVGSYMLGSAINKHVIGEGTFADLLGRPSKESVEETTKEKLFRSLLSKAARGEKGVVKMALKAYEEDLIDQKQYEDIVNAASKSRKRKSGKKQDLDTKINEIKVEDPVKVGGPAAFRPKRTIRPKVSTSPIQSMASRGPSAVNVSRGLGSMKGTGKTIIPTNVGDRSALGFISAKYESKGDVATISSGKEDPGGVSYGKHQLASKTGTLQRYLKQSQYGAQFEGLRPGTQAFNNKWKELAATDPNFGQDQHEFITRTHYDPAAAAAKEMGFDISNKGVQEAIYSGSVQHGGVKKILKMASGRLGPNATPEEQINAFYDARTEYMQSLSKVPEKTKSNIINNRYAQERKDTLALATQSGGKLALATQSGGKLALAKRPGMSSPMATITNTNVSSPSKIIPTSVSVGSSAPALQAATTTNANLFAQGTYRNQSSAPTINNFSGGGGSGMRAGQPAPPSKGVVDPRPKESTFYDLQRKALLSSGV